MDFIASGSSTYCVKSGICIVRFDIRCIYSPLEISAGDDQFQPFAWDTDTQSESTSTSLEGYYIVMPMLSK